LAAFLTAGGVPAVALGVDRSGHTVNNPGSFTVYATQGVDRGELVSKGDPLKDRAAQLGRSWQREQKGYSDLSDMYWQKYSP